MAPAPERAGLVCPNRIETTFTETEAVRLSQIDSAETLHRELVQLIAQRAYERRRPGVSSGDSDFYIDTKFVSLHPRGAYCIGQLILKRLKELDCHTVGGMSIGGIPIVSVIAALSDEANWPVNAFFVRKDVESIPNARKVEGNLDPGARAVFVDDVISGGTSTLRAIREVEAAGGSVDHVIVIVDREEGGPDLLRAAGYTVESLVTRTDVEEFFTE